ncbi:MAG: ABC transporter permease [Clostridia bacterium]|nr:ABC transporter permease [Clostridia bacterium]
MMSKTFSIKTRETIKMIAVTLRKNIGLLALLTIGLLLISPGFMLRSIDEMGKNELMNHVHELDQVVLSINAVVGGMMIFLFNFIHFSFLYTKRAGDVFFALPLTRGSLLFSRAAAGFMLTMIPITVSSAVMVVVHLVTGVSGVGGFLLGFLLIAACVLLFGCFSLIFFTAAGSVFDLLVSFIGINAGVLILVLFYHLLCENFLIGFTSSENTMTAVMSRISPIFLAGEILVRFISGATPCTLSSVPIRCFIEWGVWTVGSILLTAVLFKRRPTEASGGSYAFRFMPILCGLVAANIGAFVVGMIFSQEEMDAPFWVFAVIGGLLFAVAYGAVTNRGFKMLKQSFVIGGIAVLFLAATTVVVASGGFGYETRLPKQKDIVSAEVSLPGFEQAQVSPEAVLALHGAVVEQLEDLTPAEEDVPISLTISYQLKGNRTMEREYTVGQNSAIEQKLLAIYRSPERIQQLKKEIDAVGAGEYVALWQQYTPEEQDAEWFGETVPLTNAELRHLTDAYFKDLPHATTDSLYRNDLCAEYLIEIHGGKNADYYRDFLLRVEPGFAETKAALEALNLPERIAQQRALGAEKEYINE